MYNLCYKLLNRNPGGCTIIASGQGKGHLEAPGLGATDSPLFSGSVDWVAIKGLKLSYYIGETLLFTTYTHYGNLI